MSKHEFKVGDIIMSRRKIIASAKIDKLTKLHAIVFGTSSR